MVGWWLGDYEGAWGSGDIWNTLKEEIIKTKKGETKIFLKWGGQAGWKSGALKGGGDAGTPLQTML